MSELEWLAALLGLIAVWLTVKQNLWCWPVGLLMVVLYAWLFYDWKLYSNALLQGVFAALQIYGWWQWSRGGVQQQGRQLTSLQLPAVIFGLILGALIASALGYIMATYTDAQAPWLDASLTAFSLIAQWWMAQKRVQCWALWIAVDIIYVAFFIDSGLYTTAALYAAFTALAVNGLLTWRHELKRLAV